MSVRSSLPPALLAGLAASVAGLMPAARSADLPPELRYVPADAAVFVHADAAKLYGGPIGKAVRAADPKLFADLTAQSKALFGLTADDLWSVTAFWPKVKGPQDAESFGVVLTFTAVYDKEKLTEGLRKGLGNQPFSVHAASDRTAVVLVGLDEEYAKPRPAGEAGPLAAAIKEAGTGKHLVVAAAAPGSLPDEVRGDDLPPDILPFKPLLQADAVVGLIDAGAALTAEVRVTAGAAAGAVEAEKALGLLAKLMRDGLAEGRKEVARDPNDAGAKDILALLDAADAGLKGAKFTTQGNETRAVVTLPADLPFGGAFVNGLQKVRGAAAVSRSSNNLKQIALALHNYHDVHGAFPPAAVVDKDGKPLLSWRVLILPYVEQDNLFKEFHTDEPWDSEHNKKLLDRMPQVYALPEHAGPGETKTHYRVFTGNGAAFDLLQGPKIQNFTDGTSNTLLVATAAEAVPWTKPDELAYDPDKDPTKQLGYLPGGKCMVAFGDGSVRALKKGLARKTLDAIITRGGGEVIDDPDF